MHWPTVARHVNTRQERVDGGQDDRGSNLRRCLEWIKLRDRRQRSPADTAREGRCHRAASLRSAATAGASDSAINHTHITTTTIQRTYPAGRPDAILHGTANYVT